MSQPYTFAELVAWKAKSQDPQEQKKIRRLIRALRATDPSVPSLKRGINANSPVVQPSVEPDLFDPTDKSTWPTITTYETLPSGKRVSRVVLAPAEHWTEEMHFKLIDHQAVAHPIHQHAHVDAAGVPQLGCGGSCCATRNWAVYDVLLAEAEREREAAAQASRKLKKAAKKAAKKIKVTKVSSV